MTAWDNLSKEPFMTGVVLVGGRSRRFGRDKVLSEFKGTPLLDHVVGVLRPLFDEVILVDGHSTDSTIAVAEYLMPSIKIVRQEGRGKGNALRAGFDAAPSDILVMIDADGSTQPSEIPAFVEALVEGADFVKGSRFAAGGGTSDMSNLRRFGNWGFTTLVKVLFGGSFTDLCYGYNAFWHTEADRILGGGDGFEGELAAANQQARSASLDRLATWFPGYDFAATYESAREIGGDLYDFIEWPADPARVGLLIADVSGKGTAAALFMAHSRAMIRGAAQTQPGPGATLAAANVQIARDNHAMLFVSAFYAVLEAADGRLTFANAGHNLPFIRRADGQVEEVMSRGMVLGIMDDMAYDEAATTLAAGDILLLYTDGITEAESPDGTPFDEAGLERTLALHAGALGTAAAAELGRAVFEAVERHRRDTRLSDDLTVLVLSRLTNSLAI